MTFAHRCGEQHELLRLRDDLKWTLHEFADGASYTVVDPTTGLNYQIGLAEYALASMLDGRTSIEDAAAATRTLSDRSGNSELAVDDDEAAVIAAWLCNMKLATAPIISFLSISFTPLVTGYSPEIVASAPPRSVRIFERPLG